MTAQGTAGQQGTAVMVAVPTIIVAAERRALVRESVVEQLMGSIERRGLLAPVRLSRDNTLVCGLHRLVAFERLDRAEIPAIYCDGSDVDVELDEIEENLCRRDLTVLERARHELRQKELYVVLHEGTRPGVAGARARRAPAGLQAKDISFAALQAKPRDGRRMHEQRAQIAEALGACGDRLLEHPIANVHTQLLELARLPDAIRGAAIDMLATGRAKTAKEVVAQLRAEPAPPRPRTAPRVPVSCPITSEPDGYVATTTFAGRNVRIHVATGLDICTLQDEGPAPAPRPTPRTDARVLTFANSLAAPDEVVAELPRDLAASVRLSPIYVDDHCRCERCGSTWVWGDATYICRTCTPPGERVAYGYGEARSRNIQSPRVFREIAIDGVPRHRILWSYAPDSSPDAPQGSVHVEHWSSSVERWHIEIEPTGTTTVERFKVGLRVALLQHLDHLGILRHVRGRFLREDGSESVLLPGEPMTALPAQVERRVGLESTGCRVRNPLRPHQDSGGPIIRLKVRASKLIGALDFVSLVEPRNLAAQQNSAAYLFNCSRDKDGKAICRVYSRGQDRVARAGFELEELDGEGLFTMPSKHVDVIRQIPDDTVTIESRTETRTGEGAFVVALRSTSGTSYEHTTYDPRLIAPCDLDFSAAKKNGHVVYNVGILREALSLARPFLPDAAAAPETRAQFKTIQIFDASNPDWATGDGNLFCSDASRAFYFECRDFMGKGVALPMGHVPVLQKFLARCDGVTIYRGTNLSFAVNADKGHERDRILAWNHDTRTHARFAYYAMSRDKYVIIVPKGALLKALDQAEILIDQKQDRVKLVYTHKNSQTGGHTLHFGTSESAGKLESRAVETRDKKNRAGKPSLEEDFVCFVNLGNFRSIIQDVVGDDVELRISPIPKDEGRPRGGAMLRTIEELWFDVNGKRVTVMGDGGAGMFRCKVTRFMPSTV